MSASNQAEHEEGLEVALRSLQLSGDREARRVSSPFTSRSSRESTPHRITYESLARRPRSNQRSRTPRNAESPLNADAFRREEPSPERREGMRITVRPLAGMPVGTTFGRTTRGGFVTERPTTPLSSKQGPSQRKTRRWNNDSFVGIASELNPIAAEALLKAKADAHLYRSVYNPLNHPESTVSRFMTSNDMKGVREEFSKGEIGYGAPTAPACHRKEVNEADLTPDIMMNRIHDRLRKVVIRACASAPSTVKIVNSFERFLVECFVREKKPTLDTKASSSLLKPPMVTQSQPGHTIARFYFDSDSSSGGFHRLLLHAVCQFHGMNAISTTTEIEKPSKVSSRLLTVTGRVSGATVRLTDHAVEGQ